MDIILWAPAVAVVAVVAAAAAAAASAGISLDFEFSGRLITRWVRALFLCPASASDPELPPLPLPSSFFFGRFPPSGGGVGADLFGMVLGWPFGLPANRRPPSPLSLLLEIL